MKIEKAERKEQDKQRAIEEMKKAGLKDKKYLKMLLKLSPDYSTGDSEKSIKEEDEEEQEESKAPEEEPIFGEFNQEVENYRNMKKLEKIIKKRQKEMEDSAE